MALLVASGGKTRRFSSLNSDGTNSTDQLFQLRQPVEAKGATLWQHLTSGSANRVLRSTLLGNGSYINIDTDSTEHTGATNFEFTARGFTRDSVPVTDNFQFFSWIKSLGAHDVVQYTGNGASGRSISHNLGSVPKMIMILDLDNATGTIPVWHDGLASAAYSLDFTGTGAKSTTNYFGGAGNEPTASDFTVGNAGTVNSTGDNYLALLWGDDAPLCASGVYTGTAIADTDLDIGFTPELFFMKAMDSAQVWSMIYDDGAGGSVRVDPITTNAPADASSIITFIDGGVRFVSTSSSYNGSGIHYAWFAWKG